jgi:spore coat polysaccharide biosynthesis predicted glycosyltransferase SpsG
MKSHHSDKLILMDPFPALGHINAFLNLARWLSGKGCEIVFIGSAEHSQIYQREGFRFYGLNPMIIIPEAYEIKVKGQLKFFLDNFYRSRNKRSREYFERVSKDYEKIIGIIKPDLILLDDHYALKTFFYNKFEINLLLVSTMTVALKSKETPPFQSTFVPKGNQASRWYMGVLWTLTRINRTAKN